MTREQLEREVQEGIPLVEENKRAIVAGRECWTPEDVAGAFEWAVGFYGIPGGSSTEGGAEPVKPDPSAPVEPAAPKPDKPKVTRQAQKPVPPPAAVETSTVPATPTPATDTTVVPEDQSGENAANS